jgi:NAD(P)-dependent dehydrogenase (short-subunit alcohol dehydrogenase family)
MLPLLIRNPGSLVVEVTDGTAEYNATHYRLSLFYDLAKISVIRLAWAQAQELQAHQGTAVALTPGWLRSEMMLDIFGVTEENWRDALSQQPHFAISETPRFVGRAVVVLGDQMLAESMVNPFRAASGEGLWLYRSDGSQPDCWRYMREVQDAAGQPMRGYR